MTAKAHRPGEAAEQQAADVETVKAVAEGQNAPIVGPGAPTADLANVTTPPATSAAAAAQAPEETAETEETDETPLAELKALGNARPDVTVTAVRNAQGHFSWTARDADGTELARGPHPHSEAVLLENLTKLFSGTSTVALRRTGDDKARRLA